MANFFPKSQFWRHRIFGRLIWTPWKNYQKTMYIVEMRLFCFIFGICQKMKWKNVNFMLCFYHNIGVQIRQPTRKNFQLDFPQLSKAPMTKTNMPLDSPWNILSGHVFVKILNALIYDLFSIIKIIKKTFRESKIVFRVYLFFLGLRVVSVMLDVFLM